LIGAETLDVEGKISVRELVRSKIFKVFSLPYLQAAIALPTVYYILTQVSLSGPVEAAMYVVVVNIVAHSVIFAVIYGLMRGEFRLPVPWLSVAKYVFAALVAAVLLVVIPQTTTLTTTFAKVLLGVGVYAMLLLVIDGDARKLGKRIVEEIQSVFH
jgi:hypothetical protein